MPLQGNPVWEGFPCRKGKNRGTRRSKRRFFVIISSILRCWVSQGFQYGLQLLLDGGKNSPFLNTILYCLWLFENLFLFIPTSILRCRVSQGCQSDPRLMWVAGKKCTFLHTILILLMNILNFFPSWLISILRCWVSQGCRCGLQLLQDLVHVTHHFIPFLWIPFGRYL